MVKCELQEGMGLSSRWWFTVMEAGNTSGQLKIIGIVGADPVPALKTGNRGGWADPCACPENG